MPHKHHISHIEIPALKNSDAAEFYKKVFDWNIEHSEEMNYTMFSAEGGTGGGFSEVSEENPVGNVLLILTPLTESQPGSSKSPRRHCDDGKFCDSHSG